MEKNRMAIRPLYDRIIVTRTEPERTTASGIVIPDSAGEKPDQGEVIAIGNGKLLANGELRPLAVKAGDRVLFGKYAGQAVKIDGKDALVLREEDVIAIIEG
jgi:chaperonin GroES